MLLPSDQVYKVNGAYNVCISIPDFYFIVHVNVFEGVNKDALRKLIPLANCPLVEECFKEGSSSDKSGFWDPLSFCL